MPWDTYLCQFLKSSFLWSYTDNINKSMGEHATCTRSITHDTTCREYYTLTNDVEMLWQYPWGCPVSFHPFLQCENDIQAIFLDLAFGIMKRSRGTVVVAALMGVWCTVTKALPYKHISFHLYHSRPNPLFILLKMVWSRSSHQQSEGTTYCAILKMIHFGHSNKPI
jgi:hypothetical protein